MKLALAVALAAIVAGLFGGQAAHAGSACSIAVPHVWAGDQPGEVYTGHAVGSCTFKWRLQQQIEYKDRWHILGTTWHGPYPAGATVTVPSDEHTYASRCGWWRVRDVAYDTAGHQRFAGTGAESWFCT
jgi:hypothetical protein